MGLAVERIDAPSFEVFNKEILAANTPVIITGAMEDWPALSKWSVEYLKEMAGDREVRVTRSESDVYNAAAYTHMSLRHFFQHLEDPDDESQYYITGITPSDDLPEIAPDLRTPGFIDDGRELLQHLFLGRDSVTGCHFHSIHQNVLTQIMGTKRVVLYSPDDFGNVYPKPFYARDWNWSRIQNFEDADYGQFPRLARAEPIEVVLEPGMILHIPVHWWHVVYGEDMSASLAFFWPAPMREWAFPHPGLRTSFQRFGGGTVCDVFQRATSVARRLSGRAG